MTSKDEQYDAIAAIGELGSDDENPFIKGKPEAVFYEDASETEKKIVDQVNKNKHAEKRIAMLGMELSNVGGVSEEFMVEWIVNNVLTQAQREDLALAWAQHYSTILADMEGKARELRMAHDRAKLATPPPSPGLIIPGHLRRPGR